MGIVATVSGCGSGDKGHALNGSAVIASLIWTLPTTGTPQLGCSAHVVWAATPVQVASSGPGTTRAQRYTVPFAQVPAQIAATNGHGRVCEFESPVIGGIRQGKWTIGVVTDSGWRANCVRTLGSTLVYVRFAVGSAGCT
jgi:hypothetical protein